VPLYHIFGSEELSVRTPALAQRSSRPYVALSPADAAALEVGAGTFLDVDLDGLSIELPVVVRPGLPAGVAGLPVGLRGMPHLGLPARARLRRRERP
jgi:NADH-quinone oxidoreductase subunit G